MNFSLQLQLFLRSFLLQAGWNYTKYQSLGFTFVMLPVLRRLYKEDPAIFAAVLQRYLDTFNTHPVMASFCYGAAAKQEEAIQAAQSVTDYKEKVLEWTLIRKDLSITAASIGDRLFWGTLKPLTLLLALFIWMMSGVNFLETKNLLSPTTATILSAPICAWFVYNTIAVFVRWKAIKISYNSDEKSCFGLTQFDWNRTIYNTKRAGLLFTIVLVVGGIYTYLGHLHALDVHFVARSVLILFFVLLSFVTHRRKIPNVYLYLATVLIFTLVCLF